MSSICSQILECFDSHLPFPLSPLLFHSLPRMFRQHSNPAIFQRFYRQLAFDFSPQCHAQLLRRFLVEISYINGVTPHQGATSSNTLSMGYGYGNPPRRTPTAALNSFLPARFCSRLRVSLRSFLYLPSRFCLWSVGLLAREVRIHSPQDLVQVPCVFLLRCTQE